MYGIVLTEQSCPCVFNPNGLLGKTTIITASLSGHSTFLCHCFGFIKQDNDKGYLFRSKNTFIYLNKYSTLPLGYDHLSSKNYNNDML